MFVQSTVSNQAKKNIKKSCLLVYTRWNLDFFLYLHCGLIYTRWDLHEEPYLYGDGLYGLNPLNQALEVKYVKVVACLT